MTHRKKLIEVALPLEAINAASAREKSIRHGHPSTLHLWWARRPLAACRAVIFSSLVDDPDDPDAPSEFVQACRELPRGKNAAENDTPRQRLFDFIETLVTWESTTDEGVLETARRLIRLATDGNPPPLLDPFAGGGSIPLEAQRLGLEAHASDLNPVAVMINKALIEIPPRFADMPPVNPRDREKLGGTQGWKGAAGLAADVRYYGQWMRDRAWERIGHFYPDCNGETVIAWLWTRTVKSPNPAVKGHVPLTRSFLVSRRKDRRAWVEPIIDSGSQSISYVVKQGSGKPPEGTMGRRGGRCLVTGAPIPYEYIAQQGQAKQMGTTMMAVITQGQQTWEVRPATQAQIDIADIPNPEDAPNTTLPEQGQGLGFRVQRYGLTRHLDLFSPRQSTALVAFSDLVTEAQARVHADALASGLNGDDLSAKAYAEAVGTYLAFSVSRSSDYWSTLTMWANGFIAHTFTRNALPMIWDYAEANPFSNSTGNWLGAIDWIARALEKLMPTINGQADQRDATELDFDRRVAISTDPPYYDNIGYADLSDYFYVWLRRSLQFVYPEIFSTLLVPKEPELIADGGRHGGSDAARRHFETGLTEAFSRMRSIVTPHFPMTVYYAFKQAEDEASTENGISISSTGWETMLEGLILSGFMLTGTWPVRTERTGRIRDIGSNALASSIVLICRPRPEGAPMTSRREFVNALRRELPAALREMQSGNIAPVDMAQASIGPGMAVYSRYSRVLEPNGDRLTVRTALQLINHELDAYLAEQEGYVDADSRFAVAWFQQFGFEGGPFGQADVLARAKNTSVDGLAYAGVLESGAGVVQLKHWSGLDPGWDPATDKRLTVWEAVHHLIERLNTHGEEGAARLLARLPSDLAAQARQLAYRLYSICERKGWAEHARDYNALVISWGASQEQAREFKEQYQQGRLL